MVFRYPSGNIETHHTATGKYCRNFKAETEAIMKAVSLIEDSKDVSKFVFLTDARSVMANNKSPELAKAIQHLSTSVDVVMHVESQAMKKLTNLQNLVHCQSNQMSVSATKRKSPISSRSQGQNRRLMPTTF